MLLFIIIYIHPELKTLSTFKSWKYHVIWGAGGGGLEYSWMKWTNKSVSITEIGCSMLDLCLYTEICCNKLILQLEFQFKDFPLFSIFTFCWLVKIFEYDVIQFFNYQVSIHLSNLLIYLVWNVAMRYDFLVFLKKKVLHFHVLKAHECYMELKETFIRFCYTSINYDTSRSKIGLGINTTGKPIKLIICFLQVLLKLFFDKKAIISGNVWKCI